MFWSSALSLLAFPIYITVSGGLIIGMLCCYILHLVECWHLNRKELIEITKPKLFSLQTCTKKQLISRCKECNLKPQEMRRAIWIFADNLSNDEIILADYKITGVMLDYDTIYKIKSRLKKKLS